VRRLFCFDPKVALAALKVAEVFICGFCSSLQESKQRMPAVQLDYRIGQPIQPSSQRLRKSPHNSARKRLLSFLASELETDLCELFADLLARRNFNQSLFLKTLNVAAHGTGAPWATRRLAVLMLEHQVLRIPARDLEQFSFVFNQLNLKDSPAPDGHVVQSVRKEGYTSTSLPQFTEQFRRRLARLNRIHSRIKGWKTSQAAIRDFLDFSRQECRLTLARYVFKPDEVVDEILRLVLTSDGMPDLNNQQPLFVQAGVERAFERMPEFEATILKSLTESARIYWVTGETSSEINSLVEYPLTTVVLVIKLPGSDLEFEIKRAGKRPPFGLQVIHARNGYEVAPSHRLDGGNMLWLLRHEAIAAAKLGRVFELVHDRPAPLPTYVSRSSISTIPSPDGDVQTINYFTDPAVFGDLYDEMRRAMTASVASFKAEGYMTLPDLPTPLGLTAQFLSTVVPGQAILHGTSSFRVDKMAAYLSSDGAARYAALTNLPLSREQARNLADTLLEEVLGIYRPPAAYGNYRDYLATAFALPENRARANSTYKSILQQIGKMWGTLMGIKGYSKGESFVARNVGLRSVWEDGEWTVRTIFMDHDSMVIPGFQENDFWPVNALEGMILDEVYIWGRPGGIIGTVGHLRNLYRVDDELHPEARRLAEIATRDAYQETQRELLRNPKLQKLFEPVFIERLADWNRLVRSLLRAKPDTTAQWKERTRKVLAAKDYHDGEVTAYVEGMAANRSFLERQSFLFAANERERHPGR